MCLIHLNSHINPVRQAIHCFAPEGTGAICCHEHVSAVHSPACVPDTGMDSRPPDFIMVLHVILGQVAGKAIGTTGQHISRPQ